MFKADERVKCCSSYKYNYVNGQLESIKQTQNEYVVLEDNMARMDKTWNATEHQKHKSNARPSS